MSSQEEEIRNLFDERLKELNLSLKIAFVGEVSTGKTSLMNAFLDAPQNSPMFKVDSCAGTTTKPEIHKLDDHVIFIDTPGLNDTNFKNSDQSLAILKEIDVGIFVIAGAIKKTNLDEYNVLKKYAKKVFVVMNKIDNYDRNKKGLEKVIDQWAAEMNIKSSEIYTSCSFGYDLNSEGDLDIRGIDKLRTNVLEYLKGNKKDIFVYKFIKDKRPKAIAIIIAAAIASASIGKNYAVAVATQLSAAAYIHYIYKGNLLSINQAYNLLPILMGGSLLWNTICMVASLLPLSWYITFALGAARSGAVLATVSSLTTLTIILEKKIEFENRDTISKLQENIKSEVTDRITNASMIDFLSHQFWFALISDMLSNNI